MTGRIQHASTQITGALFAQTWRTDEKYGSEPRAEVRLGETSLVFDDAASAREVAAACIEAAEALDELEAEGKSGTEGSGTNG